MIERNPIDLSEERRILQHMITSTPFLSKLQNIAQPRLFQSSFSRTVAEWIWEYFTHTQEAPGRGIEEVYLKKKKDIDEDDSELIREFLDNLSSDWEKAQVHNVQYTTKNALEFFKLRSLDQLSEDLGQSVEAQDHAYGERLVSEYRNIEKSIGRGVNLLKDPTPIIHAFSHEYEYLFEFPGDLGKYVGKFMRGDFLAFMGAMKRGKTHYLWFTGYRALLSGLKVVFVSLEMTELQMLRRMWQTMVGQPVKAGSIRMPYFEDDKIRFRTKDLKGIDLTKVSEKQKFYRRQLRTGDLRLITYPAGSGSIEDIETELVNLEYYEGFVPDVVVIDYADLLKPTNKAEYRHQLDATWKALRGMAQERSILVATATQTGRQGLQRDSKGWDVAEDIRKLGHTTIMLALNQNKRERKDGVMRIEWVVRREGPMFPGQVVVLQCLDIGRPYMDSRLKSEVDMKKYEEKAKEEKV